MELLCLKCGRLIHAHTAREYARHLRMSHAVFGNGETLVCGQNGCMRTFTLMNSLLRHIRRHHARMPVAHNDPLHGDFAHEEDDDEGEDDQANYDEDVEDAEHVYEPEDFNLGSLKKLAMNLVIKLRSSTSTTYSTIQSVITCTKNMFQETLSSLRQRMITVMQHHGIDTNSPDVQELNLQFQELENPYTGIETPGQQMKYMIENLMLVPPVERALGTRIDHKLDRKTGQTNQVVVTETFQYLPMLEVLKLVLKPDARALIDSEIRSPEGILRG